MTIKITKERLIQEASSKKGKIINPEDYKRNTTKLLWECQHGHQWLSTWDCVHVQNHWCHECSNQIKKSIQAMIDYAKTKNGTCLSSHYVNAKTKLIWECENKHTWEATPDNVVNGGKWCPKCKQSQAETLCISTASSLLNIPFIKTRIHVKGRKRPLELDGYNETYRIAIEYNGEQHYVSHKKFHTLHGRHSLQKQQERDKEKKEYCEKNDIYLIVVPYTERNQFNQVFLSLLETTEPLR